MKGSLWKEPEAVTRIERAVRNRPLARAAWATDSFRAAYSRERVVHGQNRSQEDARTVILCLLYDDLTDHDVRVVVVTYHHVLGGCWCL